ncbi:MAG TPA: DUF481 domain-containing protein [Chitinophagaceae bacterium]|nr:DUF481 domain-containing protein [Chitinophagaceae bacterium]
MFVFKHYSLALLRWVITGLCCVMALTMRAQFSDSVHHNIGFGATGIINSTNSNSSFVVNNAIRYNINKKNRYFNSNAAWIYGRQNGRQTNNDFTAAMDYNVYGWAPHWYYWGLLTFEKSFSLKINSRSQGGAGLGYTLSEKKEANIVLSNGLLYEYSNLKIDSVNNDSYSTIRNSFRLKYHFVFAQVITLDGVHFWQQSLSSGEDYIIKSSSSLSVKIKKWLSLSTALTYNKVNRTDSRNLLFTIGLSADYYF